MESNVVSIKCIK